MTKKDMVNGRRLIFAAMIWAFVLAGVASAQSTDRDRPTPLTTNEISGRGTEERVEYYYRFVAEPGEVVVTLDIKARRLATSAAVELFTLDARRLLKAVGIATSTSVRDVKRVDINRRQPLIMRLTLDENAGPYLVRVEGSVNLDNPEHPREARQAAGMLRIEMKDGTAQEIDMRRVRRIVIDQ